MLPAQPHRQFGHPFHRRFLRRFLAHPVTDAPEFKWFLQSKFVSTFSGQKGFNYAKAQTR
jgi:hypothetical protein